MDKIIDIITNENESSYLDFKKTMYTKENKIDFIKDIVAMANSHIIDDKYIVVGVKDEPDKEKDFIGIENVSDVSDFEQLIHYNVEPTIEFEFLLVDYDNKKLGVFRLFNCIDRPYIIKKKIENSKKKKIEEGDSFIRKGTCNTKMLRSDFELIYSQRQNIFVLKSGEIKRTIDRKYSELNFILLICEEENSLNLRINSFYSALEACKKSLSENLKFNRFSSDHQDYEELKILISDFISNYEYILDKEFFMNLLKETSLHSREELISKLVELEQKQYDLNVGIKRTREFERSQMEYLTSSINKTDIRSYKSSIFSNRNYIEHIKTPLYFYPSGEKFQNTYFEIRKESLIREIKELEKKLR